LKLKNTYTSRDFLDLGHNLSVPTAKISDTAGWVTQHRLLAAAAAFAAAAIFDTATDIALDSSQS